ncbi:MAG: glycosyltransferase family 2 protein [bacterium]|nr:glycosyltransferase family 2 protein [bacterium]
MTPLTVVICTYNRAGLLAKLLDSLIEQGAPKDGFEVLVVDNASTDRTQDVCRDYADRLGRFRSVVEDKRGLSQARNRGWREAAGTYVLYLDDDCTVPPDYVEVALAVARDVAPAMFGGPVLPAFDAPRPRWFKDAYVAYELTDSARALTPEEFVFGGNMAVRREKIERLGGFNPRFGMSGGALGYGEEILPQQALRAEMPDETIWYEPGLVIHHLTRREKMTLRWGFRNAYVRGIYLDRVFHADKPVPERSRLRKRMIETGIAVAKDLVKAVVRRDRERFPHVGNYIHEHTFEYVTELGRLREKLRRASAPSGQKPDPR